MKLPPLKDKGLEEKRQYFVGVYARISVDCKEEKKESIDNQILLVRDFVSNYDNMKIADTYSDIGTTGTNFERREFQRLMQDVRLGKINCVVVKDFSRFGRNYIETGNYIEKIFPFMGVRFISITDQFDSENPEKDNENLALHLKNIVNELYAKDIGIRVESAKEIKIKQGSFVGGIPAYGYEVRKEGLKRVLYPQEGTCQIVKDIFEYYDNGRVLNDIVKQLYERKVLRPTEYHKCGHVYQASGDELKQWSAVTLITLLTNPIYMGTLIQRTKKGKEPIIIPNAHLPIIEYEVFDRVSRLAENNKKSRVKTEEDVTDDIFRNIIFCGECGKPLRKICRAKKQPYNQVFRSYSYGCPGIGRLDNTKCQNHYLSESTIKKIMFQSLKVAFMLSENKIRKYILFNKEKAENRKKTIKKMEKEYIRKLDKITLQISDDYLKYRKGKFSEELFKEIMKKRGVEKSCLKEKLAELQAVYQKIDDKAEQVNRSVRALVRGRADILPDQEMVRLLIKRINVYTNKRVEIIFNFNNEMAV